MSTQQSFGSTPSTAMPVDTLARPLHDLRISVTDRCNLRCTYCMPREVFGKDFAFLPRANFSPSRKSPVWRGSPSILACASCAFRAANPCCATTSNA